MWRIPKQSSVQNSAIHSWKNVSCTIQIKEINVAAPLLEENIRFSGRHDTVFRMASWRQVEQTEATQAGPRHLSHSLCPHLPHLVPAPVCKVMLLEEPPLTLPINTTPFSSLSRICSCAYCCSPPPQVKARAQESFVLFFLYYQNFKKCLAHRGSSRST